MYQLYNLRFNVKHKPFKQERLATRKNRKKDNYNKKVTLKK